MKMLLQIIGAASWLVAAGVSSAAELSVTVTNIQQTEGSLYIRVYDKTNKWLSQEKNGPRATAVISAADLKTMKDITKTFDLPVGKYAVTAILDVNNNGTLDKNWMGKPTEPTGQTHKGEALNGPPAFEDCVFEMQGSTQKTIELSNS